MAFPIMGNHKAGKWLATSTTVQQDFLIKTKDYGSNKTSVLA